MAKCTCFPVPEEYHFVYYGITEPGSMWEPNPECQEHFPGDQPAKVMDRRDNLLAGLNDAPSALTGWDLVDRPLPAPRPVPASSLERFAAAMDAIAETFSRILFPRVPLADPTQDDVVRGA